MHNTRFFLPAATTTDHFYLLFLLIKCQINKFIIQQKKRLNFQNIKRETQKQSKISFVFFWYKTNFSNQLYTLTSNYVIKLKDKVVAIHGVSLLAHQIKCHKKIYKQMVDKLKVNIRNLSLL